MAGHVAACSADSIFVVAAAFDCDVGADSRSLALSLFLSFDLGSSNIRVRGFDAACMIVAGDRLGTTAGSPSGLVLHGVRVRACGTIR